LQNGFHGGVVGYDAKDILAASIVRSLPGTHHRWRVLPRRPPGSRCTDSPQHLAPKNRAKLHIGLAETDDWMTQETVDRLTAALDKAGVDYQAEVCPGSRHGWAAAVTPIYPREGAEHHWDRLLDLFRATLQGGVRGYQFCRFQAVPTLFFLV